MRRQLLFEVGDHLFAVDSGVAREVIEPREATPVPGANPGVIGLINLRGALMIAGDLEELLGMTPSEHEEQAFVVFEQGGRRLALRVDRVVAVIPYPEVGDAEGAEGEKGAEGAEVAHTTAGHPAPLRESLVEGAGAFGERRYYRLAMEEVFAGVLMPETEGRDRPAGGW